PLPLAGLVDRQALAASMVELDQKRGVRRPRHPAQQLDLAALQELSLLGAPRLRLDHASSWRACPFNRGQTWPDGSSGPPHSGHGGRPCSTAALPRVAMARAWAAVK